MFRPLRSALFSLLNLSRRAPPHPGKSRFKDAPMYLFDIRIPVLFPSAQKSGEELATMIAQAATSAGIKSEVKVQLLPTKDGIAGTVSVITSKWDVASVRPTVEQILFGLGGTINGRVRVTPI